MSRVSLAVQKVHGMGPAHPRFVPVFGPAPPRILYQPLHVYLTDEMLTIIPVPVSSPQRKRWKTLFSIRQHFYTPHDLIEYLLGNVTYRQAEW